MRIVFIVIGVLVPFIGFLFIGIYNWDEFDTGQCMMYVACQVLLPILGGVFGDLFWDSVDDDGLICGP